MSKQEKVYFIEDSIPDELYPEDWMIQRRRHDLLESLGENEEIDISVEELTGEWGEVLWLLRLTLIRKYPPELLDDF